jgi:GT2 family glycosyltransferase
MCLSKKFISEIGILSEEYFLYYEELDLVERSKNKFKVACSPESIVYHKEGQSINGVSNLKHNKRSKIADFYGIRNRITFSLKYHPFCVPTVYLWIFLILLNKILKGEIDTALLIINIMLHPFSKYKA